MKLTLKQWIFVKEYVRANGNATEAAMKVYDCKSRNVAGVTGYRLLRNVNVSSAIEDILTKAGLTEETIARSLRDIIGPKLTTIKGIEECSKLKGYS